MPRKKRPRIADVAKLAGVSEGTVSVVLNNRVGERVRVSEDTQKKVWEAVQKLGYVANPLAQSLAGGQNRIIAVFTFESIFPIDSRNFYYPFLVGIEEEADALGYDILLVTGSGGSPSGKRTFYQNGVNRLQRADGAILLGHGERSEINRLLDEEYPFVFVGRRYSPDDNIQYVGADYASATVNLINHLVERGHTRLAFIRSIRDTEASQDRESGVIQAIELHNLDLPDNWKWYGTPSELSAEVLSHYLAAGVTAFVIEDDELGQQLLRLADRERLSYPEDFSFVVLGDPLNPMIEVPDWTSFNIPRRQMGREALKLLVGRLGNPGGDPKQPNRKLLPCTFKPGKSVRQIG